MCHWTNKLPLRTLLLAVFYFTLAESASNELLSPMGAACPGDVLMYTCTVVGSGNTIWSGSAFDCDTKMNEIILRHSQFASSGTSGNCNDGAIRTQSIGVVNNNCYFSQLNVTVTSDMNGKTIQCAHSSDRVVTVGVATLSIATAPPTHVRLFDARPGELTFNWRASTDRLTDGIDSDCGNCPNMTNTTMVTCPGLTLSTTPTMCTFSVHSMACGTISSSIPIVVTLAVPAAPDVIIIPQYSMSKSLTVITVHLEQNVTSFAITDTISGSTISYNIYYSGIMKNVPACMNNICTYTVDTSCSMSSTDVDVRVASVNKLGEGLPSEPIIVECNNQFVSVDYDPETMTITCTFENKLDISLKSCRIEYGTCDQETYVTEGNTTDGPVILSLNTSGTNPENCYIVTASNGTFTVRVMEEFTTVSNSGTTGTKTIVIIVVILIVGLALIIIVIAAAVLFFLLARYRHHYADQQRLKEEQEDEFQDINLHTISSMQFTMTQIPEDFRVAKLKSRYGKYIFVERDQEEEGGREKIIDIIVKNEADGKWSSGGEAKSFIGQKQHRVFVLSRQLARKKTINKGKYILHQDPGQMKQSKFQVLYVDEDTTVAEFLKERKLKLQNKMIFRQFPPNRIDLQYYHDVVKVPSSKRKLLKQLSESPKEELTLEKSDTGIKMFYQLKPSAPGKNVKPQGDPESYYVQVTNEGLNCSLGTGSFILVYKDPDEHVKSTAV